MNSSQRDFLNRATAEAMKANCLFPEMVACEAALESNYGNSELAYYDCNLFGMKQHAHAIYGTVNLPTHEGTPGHPDWREISAAFVRYPDWSNCFADRLATLQRLSNVFPHYKAALDASDPLVYVTEVSKTWSTDQTRATKCISIYQDYLQTKEDGASCTSP
jgi:flagellum-specific peptidoglycan hydrolase FlgJ